MGKKIGLVVLGLFGVFLIVIALQSPDYVISREVTIHAPVEKVFPYLNQRKLVNAWNPWLALDAKAKISVSGPDEGVGARTSWTDGDQLGTGSATVIESVANERVKTQLEYVKPFEMQQVSEMSVKPATDGTVVVWSVVGKNHFIGRLMCVFMNIDATVGNTFQQGLQKLKDQIEKS